MPKCRPLQLNITCGCPICPYHGTALAIGRRRLVEFIAKIETLGSRRTSGKKILLSRTHSLPFWRAPPSPKSSERQLTTRKRRTTTSPFSSWRTKLLSTVSASIIHQNFLQDNENLIIILIVIILIIFI